MNYPSFSIHAVLHKDMASASKVFNEEEIEYFLFIRIPDDLAEVYELYQVDEIRDKAEFVCHKDIWEHDPGRVWYRFKAKMLNMRTGYHVYRLSMVNTVTNDTCQLYISYVVQSNKPEKPYMYMDEGERKCGCCAT